MEAKSVTLAALVFALFVVSCNTVEFKNKEIVSKYLEELVSEFQKNPTNCRFQNLILPPLTGPEKECLFFPKVYLWSPQEQFDVDITCPAHKCALEPWQWTIDTSGKKGKLPRLIYDISGNVILVQRIYLCKVGQHRHKLFSASTDLLLHLPRYLQEIFQVIIFQRSGCTKFLREYIVDNVVRGINFLQISEQIADSNNKEFCRRGRIYHYSRIAGIAKGTQYSNEDDSDDPIFSFPSSDYITSVFLNHFNEYKQQYINEMQKIGAKAISCDHTFRISKNIGAVVRGKEGKFIKQFNNLFIILNERGEVLDWRLTKTTSFEEIRDLFENLKARIEEKGERLDMVCVDDCCKVRDKYQSVFNEISVKLDLFHAVQRVTSTVHTSDILLRRKFQKEFGQVFRQDDDQNEKREKYTPGKEKIAENLHQFVERWEDVPSTPLQSGTISEIEKLKKHIQKGCVEGIPPGFGTERNEKLHSLLNRSLITGSTRISVEVAVAILTILFYYHNSKKSQVHQVCNSRLHSITPIEARFTEEASQNLKHHKSFFTNVYTEERNKERISKVNVLDDENIDNICTETIAATILNASFSLCEITQSIGNKNKNRTFDVSDIIVLNNLLDSLNAHNIYGHDIVEDATISRHLSSLKRHLSGFNLELDHVKRDGDCAFRSIVRQLHSLVEKTGEALQEHLIKLSLMKTEDEDTFHLRQLFVEEISSGNEEILEFLPFDAISLREKAEEFRTRGIFDRSLGDLVIKMCSHILRVPIMVVTFSVPYLPFIPNQGITNESIYIAFHYYGAGHYDATKELKDALEITNEQGNAGHCTCGRKKNNREKSCVTKEGNISRCPCLKAQKECNKKCRCMDCGNKTQPVTSDDLFCRCGESNKNNNDTTFFSCKDQAGKRKTRCPCFINKRGCNPSKCKCYNCGNEYGRSNASCHSYDKKRSRKCTSSPVSLKRKRGHDYLVECDVEIEQGSWSQLESCILEMSESFLTSTNVLPSKENIHRLYNYVVESKIAAELGIPVNLKSLRQVSGKIEFRVKRQEALRKISYGLTYFD